ncbi:MAG: hypothetical protein EOM67_01180 [Spirochaetia bacterium]|nr:hypothetical protein [Spirochaetia bacterium]
MINQEHGVNPRVLMAIEQEKKSLSQLNVDGIVALIESGQVERAVGHAFHFSSIELIHLTFTKVKKVIEEGTSGSLINYVSYSILMAIGLESALIKWNIQLIFTASEIKDLHLSYASLVASVPKTHNVSTSLIASYGQEVYHRYITEARSENEAKEGKETVLRGSLIDYVNMMIKEVHESSLYLYEMKLSGSPVDATTVWGNDYGLFLQFAMWCGASFQTTNPPLVKAAWDTYADDWKERVTEVYKSLDFSTLNSGNMDESQKKVSVLSYTIVEKSCHLVRDMYLASEGKLGFVCYQVNPNHQNDTNLMVDEIRFVHEMMSSRLQHGYEPNISFKIPGTKAALEAAQIVGKDGISITVTLSFGVFQGSEFAKVLSKSTSAVSSVVVMNGRLAFPVRDDLVEKFPLGKETYLESSKLVGVDVTKHLYEKMYGPKEKGGLGVDPKRVRIMNASLRIYGDEIPDVLSIWGTPSITIFPNVRYALNHKERTYLSDAVTKSVDDSTRALNAKSEIFRQSWWVEGDEASLAPKEKLTLKGNTPEEIITWGPIEATQTQFLGSYQATKDLIGFLG